MGKIILGVLVVAPMLLAGWGLITAGVVLRLAIFVGSGWALMIIGTAHVLLALAVLAAIRAATRKAIERERARLEMIALIKAATAIFASIRVPNRTAGIATGLGMIAAAILLAIRNPSRAEGSPAADEPQKDDPAV